MSEKDAYKSLVEQIKACFPTQHGIYTLKQFQQTCNMVLSTLSKNREIVRKIIDKKPVLEFEGRRIEIKSDGTLRKTTISINGKPCLLPFTKCNIFLSVPNINVVEMEYNDI